MEDSANMIDKRFYRAEKLKNVSVNQKLNHMDTWSLASVGLQLGIEKSHF